MAETLTVTVDPSKGSAQPSLEEQAALVDQALKDQAAAQANGDKPATAGLPSDGGERPAWLDAKFKTPEDLAKAYTELSKKLGEKSGEDKPTDDKSGDEKPAVDDREEARKVAEDVSKKAGLDLAALSSKWAQNGSIDAADYEALEKAGYPKAQVDTFIRAQEMVLEGRVKSVHDSVGGQDSYNAMIEWAGDNLSKDEVSAFNRAVNSDDMNSITLAVKGLKARFDAEGGYEPSVQVKGGTGKPTGSSVYRSVAELDKDMADPRYWNDPAYRADVERKLSRSDIL